MKRFQFGLDTVLQYKRQVLMVLKMNTRSDPAGPAAGAAAAGKRRAPPEPESAVSQGRGRGITIADAMGYEMGLRMLEEEIQREESRLQVDGGRRTAERMIAARQDTSSLEKLREKSWRAEKELQRQEELRIDELVANTRAGGSRPALTSALKGGEKMNTSDLTLQMAYLATDRPEHPAGYRGVWAGRSRR